MDNQPSQFNYLDSLKSLDSQKKQNLFWVVFIVFAVLVLGMSGYAAYSLSSWTVEIPFVQWSISRPSPTKVFENEYLKLTIPNDWKYQTVKSGAINILKDNYILYINPNASQASGVEGGRFSEIASGAPGADLVIKTHPSNPCGLSESSNISNQLVRSDFYINSEMAAKMLNCNAPTDEKTVWYFSYVTTKGDGYFGDFSKFNIFPTDSRRQLVITMTYQASNVNNLPVKSSEQFKKMLSEMTEIVKSIEFKG